MSLLHRGEAAAAVAVGSFEKSLLGRRKKLTEGYEASKFYGSLNDLVATATEEAFEKRIEAEKKKLTGGMEACIVGDFR